VFETSEAKSLKRHDGKAVLVENFLFEFGDGAGFENGCGWVMVEWYFEYSFCVVDVVCKVICRVEVLRKNNGIL